MMELSTSCKRSGVRLLSAILLLCLVNSCATLGVESMSSLDYPLADIQKGIKKALPIPFKNVSRDGRAFESYPFVREGKKLSLARNEEERGRAMIEIRGSSRPYTVDVAIELEAANSPNSVQKNFKTVGYDEVMARIVLARLKSYLQRSKKSLDVVDDVRIY